MNPTDKQIETLEKIHSIRNGGESGPLDPLIVEECIEAGWLQHAGAEGYQLTGDGVDILHKQSK